MSVSVSCCPVSDIGIPAPGPVSDFDFVPVPVLACPVSVPDQSATSSVSKNHLPSAYAEFANVFSKDGAETLPEHRKFDISIDLIPGATVPWGPIYNLTEPELATLRDYLSENLKRGFIRPSKSSAGAPILFVKKKDGSLRLCVDYRALNAVTIPNRVPLPLLDSLLPRLRSARVFSKIDLRGAYNLVRVKEGHEWKTAFRCQYGLYEYRVMPFGLCNAPAVFQALMTEIFRDLLDVCVIIYLDDILVFSNSERDHINHVKQVLSRLSENRLFAKLEKCQFHVESVEFLGYIISTSGISMDPSKVGVIRNWPRPQNVRDVQSFLGFANFYRRFIAQFSKIAAPLTSLVTKKTTFQWNPQAADAMDKMISAFVNAAPLQHIDFNRPLVVETDASDFAIGAVLLRVSGTDSVLLAQNDSSRIELCHY
jgi:hypothetical protein